MLRGGFIVCKKLTRFSVCVRMSQFPSQMNFVHPHYFCLSPLHFISPTQFCPSRPHYILFVISGHGFIYPYSNIHIPPKRNMDLRANMYCYVWVIAFMFLRLLYLLTQKKQHMKVASRPKNKFSH